MALNPSFDFSTANSVPAGISNNLDPRLQFLAYQLGSGVTKAATGMTESNEVAVLARVSEYDSWEALGEVRAPRLIAKSKKGVIVTGRVPISRLDAINEHDFVQSLEAPKPLHAELHFAVPETNSHPEQLPEGHQTNGGRGVVVGVIDYGLDIGQVNFRNPDGTSRVSNFWFQDGPTGATATYGRVYDRIDINAALQSVNPYEAMGYNPLNWDSAQSPGTHGTHVLDIAAGNGRGNGSAGFAPEAELMFVNVSHAEDAGLDDIERIMKESYGDSVRLIEAIRHIFDAAGDKPAVVNISLGTNGGPHDGTTLVESSIDDMIDEAPNRAVVLAASNTFEEGTHKRGDIAAGESIDLHWEVRPQELNPKGRGAEVEFWYPGDGRLRLEMLGPQGTSFFVIDPGEESKVAQFAYGFAAFVASNINTPTNGDNQMSIFLSPKFPQGTYTLRLTSLNDVDTSFHAWIERDNSLSTRFSPPHQKDTTIGSVSCGHLAISVGSYDATKKSKPLSWFSSAGPTRDGREKPEISAPGHGIVAACSSRGELVISKSGTSMAAPAVAGIIALIYSEAQARGRDLTIQELRKILFDAARQDPPNGEEGWHPRYGYGRISTTAALEELAKLD